MTLFDLAMGLGLVALAGTAAIAQNTGTKSGADKSCTCEDLVGRYKIVSGEKNGTEEPKERIEEILVTWTKDRIVVVDKEKKERYAATYELDTTKNPSTIVMTSKAEGSAGDIARGLIKKEGDTITLIYALPTGEIPNGFKTREKQLMFVMKKAD